MKQPLPYMGTTLPGKYIALEFVAPGIPVPGEFTHTGASEVEPTLTYDAGNG
jgi:hypothetical protein